MKYECECTRNNITPKQFYCYCKRELKKRCNVELSIWLDDYESWANPTIPEKYHSVLHEWDGGTVKEAIKIQPFNIQFFLSNTYNFVMEFDFSTDNKGSGYFLVKEM